MLSRTRAEFGVLVGIAAVSFVAIVPIAGQQSAPPQTPPPAGQQTPPATGRGQGNAQNFDAALQRQVQTDATWRKASDGVMKMTKTTYKSRKDGLEIPVFVFEPLKLRGPKAHAAI